MKPNLKIYLFIIASLLALSVHAEIYFEEPLSFGSIVVRDNRTQGSVIVPAYGHSSSSGGILVINPGKPGELVFTDYPPYIELTVTPILPVTTRIEAGESEQFTLDRIDIPYRIRTDSSGMARAKMGGRLTTSGNGGHYHNAAYKAFFYLDISY